MLWSCWELDHLKGTRVDLHIKRGLMAGIAAIAITGLAVTIMLQIRTAQHHDEAQDAVRHYRHWMHQEFLSGDKLRPVTIFEHWRQRGHVVVDVGLPRSGGANSMSSRLCVYDPASGRLTSPGALGRARWEPAG